MNFFSRNSFPRMNIFHGKSSISNLYGSAFFYVFGIKKPLFLGMPLIGSESYLTRRLNLSEGSFSLTFGGIFLSYNWCSQFLQSLDVLSVDSSRRSNSSSSSSRSGIVCNILPSGLGKFCLEPTYFFISYD